MRGTQKPEDRRRQDVTRDPPVPARWDACTPVGSGNYTLGNKLNALHG